MRSPFCLLMIALGGLATALPCAAQSGFEYLSGRNFACRLDAAHSEVIYVRFEFSPDQQRFVGKMAVGVWVDGTPYSQTYDITGRTDRFGSNTYKIYVENHKRISSDTPPGGRVWAYRDIDEFTLNDASGNRVTGLHTTVSPASGYNASTRSTYDSNCSVHNPGS